MGYPDKHTELQKLMKTGYGQDGPTYEGGYQLKEFKKLQVRNQSARQETEYFFVERGPGNISGRTRAFFVDASDDSQNTWFAGAASGGVWKTINGEVLGKPPQKVSQTLVLMHWRNLFLILMLSTRAQGNNMEVATLMD